MATIELAPTTTPPTKFAGAGESRFSIHDVSWDAYLAISAALGDRAGLRLAYDGGELEFMNPSFAHVYCKRCLARLLEITAEQEGIAFVMGGSTTFRRASLEKGLEPDDCFWLASADKVRGRLTRDPESDPPPDVVLEIEISPASLNRMAIYAELGVPELWRFDGETLRFEILNDGVYRSGASRSFPYLVPDVLARYLDPVVYPNILDSQVDFRSWLAANRPSGK